MPDSVEGRRILITTDAVGGVWTYSLDLVRELSAAGMECVLAIMGPGPHEDMLEQARVLPRVGVIVTGLPLDWQAADSGEVLSASQQLASLARAHDCEVVQLHSPALAAAGAFPQPVVSVHHSCLATWWQSVRPSQSLPEDFRWRIALVARGLSESDIVVAPTTALARAVAEAYGLSPPPVTIRNGRRMPSLENLPAATARERFVLTSGRLWDEGKDVATLDRAAARLAVPFVAAGPTNGPFGEVADFRQLRLLDHVSETELRRWLAGTPVFASAACYEPFGLGVLEAAQAGCALVLSDIPSFRELWSGACLFVAPGDDAGYAAAIAQLLDDPSLLRRLSSRALNRARHYTVESMARDMMRLYAGLIEINHLGRGAAA